ncbi:hypothetical protein [Methylobacterium haplocladii]|uniref:CopL family metal-binding regulatory protein n=1 Tax=Methylobacterium haplocladii TaxID=1176176 RepID=A0A512IV02_9HYPH|nr:hypothetical protein [Methylobacterium haplocladii]GEP01535.1 hypothetical protein MHA02_39220 [Methylobacterium haplocladii]GLS59187.1 hypothetical protein GCM10007887_18530 [Methylobacterium haplocladii]
MNLDRQLARLMAAMIVMIIAYVSPSAVQAHEGHAHHGHHQAAVAEVATVPPVVHSVSAPVALTRVPSAIMPAAAPETLAASAVVGSIQSDEQGKGCCSGPCKGTCCGTMSCCASAMLTGPVSLPTPAFARVVLVPYDVAGLPGVGPEALPRPPRTLA